MSGAEITAVVAGGVVIAFCAYVFGYVVGMGRGEQRVLQAFHKARHGRDDD